MSDKLDPYFFYIKPTCMAFGAFWGNSKLDHEPRQTDETLQEEDVEKRLDSIRTEREDLLRKCGYTEEDIKRANYINDVLYLKPMFILKNSKPEWTVLKIYLADQGVLFSYSDERYWRRSVSNKIVSARCQLARNPNARRHLYDLLPAWSERTLTGDLVIPEEERDLHVALLEKIYDTAAQTHMGLARWVEKHICRETPSTDERMAMVNKTFITAENEKALSEIINFILPDSYCRSFLPDSEAYSAKEQNLALFQKLLPEYKAQIDRSFCRSFVNFVLPDYMEKIRLAMDPQCQHKYVPVATKTRSVALFAQYSYRAKLLDALHDLFYKRQESNLELLKIPLFTLHRDICAASEPENAIVTAIQNYFKHIGKALSDDPRNYLLSRVQWASTITLKDDALRPAFLFYMVICCKRNLVSGRDIEVPKQTKGPWFSDGAMDHTKQRNAQLMLLDKFCEIFHLNQADKIKNLYQFLFWQGKEIQSADELAYWQKQLNNDYKLLPIIGFQLCCRAYLKDCLSAHLEDLSYTAGSPLHCGGYFTFWKENRNIVQKQARLLGEKYPDLVKDYAKVWNNPQDSFFNSKQWLEQRLASDCKIDLEEFQCSGAYNEAELRRLVLESEFRLCVCQKARARLIELCTKVCGLHRGLFTDFE